MTTDSRSGSVPDFESLDFYQLLGVSRSASPEEIKRGYRQEISKYHPDRFVNAPPAEREYASRRSQRITEAYSVLSDFAARSAYNRGEQPASGRAGSGRRVTPATGHARDYQAELYEQAQEHLAAGRTVQAIAVLRQLQQLNPFYRDSAELLTAAEQHAQARQKRGRRGGMVRPLLISGGLVGGVAALALVAWLSGMPGDSSSASGGGDQPTSQVALVATAAPTATSLPTAPPASPTPASTRPPTQALPTPTPVVPTDTPLPSPSPAPEQGALLLADDFTRGGWADLGGRGWRVGYQSGRYRIAVDPGVGTIWSYRTGPARDVSIGVDVQVASGEGGLMLRFVDERTYLSFSVNPRQTSFRLEQHSSRGLTVLAGGQSEAILSDAETPNRLVARLRGSQIELLINGQQVAGLEVPGDASSTRYGLLAISGATAAETFFDDLEIRAIQGT